MKPFYAEGNYVGEAVQQGLTKASTGTAQFLLRVKVLGTPEQDGSYTPVKTQYERSIYMPITDKTIPYFAETLDTLGYEGNGVGPLDPSHPQHQSFVGKQVDLYCKHEEDRNGDLRERWQISRSASPMKLQTLSGKELRSLDALFGRSVGRKPAPVQQVVTVTNDGTEITDDDIPF